MQAKTRLEKENTKLEVAVQKDAEEAERLREEIDELQAEAKEKAANEEEKSEQLEEEIDRLELEMDEKTQAEEEEKQGLHEKIDELQRHINESDQIQRAAVEDLYQQDLAADSEKRALETILKEERHKNARLRKELSRPDKDARALKARLEMEIENWCAAY